MPKSFAVYLYSNSISQLCVMEKQTCSNDLHCFAVSRSSHILACLNVTIILPACREDEVMSILFISVKREEIPSPEELSCPGMVNPSEWAGSRVLTRFQAQGAL